MYRLLLLLGLLGASALRSGHERRSRSAVVAVAVVATAMLYTHYYAVFMLTVVAAGELWLAWRRRDRVAAAVVGAIAAAGIAFLPWLPVFLFQTRHTGAPWASPPDANAVVGTIGSWMGGGRPAAQLSSLVAIGCVVLALVGRRGRRGEVVLQTRFARVPTVLMGAVLATLVLAILVDGIGRQAYASRYMSMGAGLFLVVVGAGIAVLPSRRARRVLLALLAAAGLSVCLQNAWQPRSEAYLVADVLNAKAQPGDLVVYCPDQLGPSTSRLLHTPARQVVFPTFGSPKVVDWVDYRSRVIDADAAGFAAQVDRLAGNHRVWLVWSLQVKPLTKECAAVIDHLVATRGVPQQPVTRHPEFGEPMSLDEFGPVTP
jgi:hypothetical protein